MRTKPTMGKKKARKRDAQLGEDVFEEVQQLAPQTLAPPGTGAFVELARAGHGILSTIDVSALVIDQCEAKRELRS